MSGYKALWTSYILHCILTWPGSRVFNRMSLCHWTGGTLHLAHLLTTNTLLRHTLQSASSWTQRARRGKPETRRLGLQNKTFSGKSWINAKSPEKRKKGAIVKTLLLHSAVSWTSAQKSFFMWFYVIGIIVDLPVNSFGGRNVLKSKK